MPHPLREELSDTEKEMLECEALKACGDPAMAKRLVAAWYWRDTRRHGADGHRVIVPPEREIPACDT
jgi:hypothetical protein